MFKAWRNKLPVLHYASLLWIVPIVYLLHELEGWNVLRWEQAHFVGLPFIPLIGGRL